MKTLKERLDTEIKLKQNGIKGIVFWSSHTILI